MNKKQEQRISRLCRMAGNIASGLSQELSPKARATQAVEIAVMIETAVTTEVMREGQKDEESNPGNS